MIKKMIGVLIIVIALMVCTNCESDECSDCGGGIIDGHLYTRVTTDDLAQLGAEFPYLKVDDCIRFKFDINNEFDLETVELVDDCCCDIYP